MQPVLISEIKNIVEYEVERAAWRPQMMALKDRRRIRVGGHLTLLFENRETVRYQIQEMARIERMVKPDDIRREVETYNELIPAKGELSASLLIEYATPEERDVRLRELLGLEKHLWLVTGGVASPARFDDRQISSDRLSAVQYVKFALTPAQVASFRQGASIRVDHPHYAVERRLTAAEIAELAPDLD
jgi:hypothetical protein